MERTIDDEVTIKRLNNDMETMALLIEENKEEMKNYMSAFNEMVDTVNK